MYVCMSTYETFTLTFNLFVVEVIAYFFLSVGVRSLLVYTSQ